MHIFDAYKLYDIIDIENRFANDAVMWRYCILHLQALPVFEGICTPCVLQVMFLTLTEYSF